MNTPYDWPALRCASRALSCVAALLRASEPVSEESVRADVGLLFHALGELGPLWYGDGESSHLMELSKRFADIDDQFSHGSEFYRLVALCMSVWDLRTTSSESHMTMALEHGIEFIRELPLELTVGRSAVIFPNRWM